MILKKQLSSFFSNFLEMRPTIFIKYFACHFFAFLLNEAPKYTKVIICFLLSFSCFFATPLSLSSLASSLLFLFCLLFQLQKSFLNIESRLKAWFYIANHLLYKCGIFKYRLHLQLEWIELNFYFWYRILTMKNTECIFKWSKIIEL